MTEKIILDETELMESAHKLYKQNKKSALSYQEAVNIVWFTKNLLQMVTCGFKCTKCRKEQHLYGTKK